MKITAMVAAMVGVQMLFFIYLEKQKCWEILGPDIIKRYMPCKKYPLRWRERKITMGNKETFLSLGIQTGTIEEI